MIKISSRTRFRTNLEKIILALPNWKKTKKTEKQKILIQSTDKESLLFQRLVKLYCLQDKSKSLGKLSKNIYIGFLGPLGTGKSTLADQLIKSLRANFVVKEPHRKNPFWQKSQKDHDFMLRSQVYFLLSNISSDLKAKQKSGISISDTCTLTDILMWAPWYHHIGYLNRKEYKTYQKLITLLKPIIPRPDLLVTLVPHSIDGLVEGIKRRCRAKPWRKGELLFSKKDLSAEIKRVVQASRIIINNWHTAIFTLTIDPIKIHNDSLYKTEVVGKILEKFSSDRV